MNLPIGKLFYFVPKIQGFTGATYPGSGIPNGDSGQHYAPVGSPGNYPGDPSAGYGTSSGAFTKNLYDLFYEGNEAALDPPGLFDYSKGRWSAITSDTTVMVWSNSAVISATTQLFHI